MPLYSSIVKFLLKDANTTALQDCKKTTCSTKYNTSFDNCKHNLLTYFERNYNIQQHRRPLKIVRSYVIY